MTSPNPASQSTRSYLLNIAWSWFSVAALLFSGIFFTRLLILHLGKDRFGIWTVAVSLVEYFWMIDLGFRPAVVKFSAEFHALGKTEELNRLINTALAYTASAGIALLVILWSSAHRIAGFFDIADPAFPLLIRAVALSWSAGLAFNIFAATLEGFHRFDLSNRASILATLLRSGVSVLAVINGYGLREMGWILVISQAIGYAMMYFDCRRIFPDMRLSPSLAAWPMARRIWGYSMQVVPGIVGARFAQAAYPSIIVYYQPPAVLTYFSQTQRMIDYAADAISRVGLVTAPRVSQMNAHGQQKEIIELTRTANRYCLTLWGLWASFLLVYGYSLCRVWIDQEFAENVTPLLPLFLGAYTLLMGQFISAAVLMGIGRYQKYSLAALAETLLSVVAMVVILPRFGLLPSVAVIMTLLAANRWFYLSRLFARQFEISQGEYLWSIFSKPLVLIGAAIAFLLLCQRTLWPGRNLAELIQVLALLTPLYGLGIWFLIVDEDHRQRIMAQGASLWRRFSNR